MGSIPALAGERWSDCSWVFARWVYPRACGGTCPRISYLLWIGGLSPRLRGNVPPDIACGIARGSIPALAGEPPRYRSRLRLPGSIPALAGERSHYRAFVPVRWVYPRACGGTRRQLDRVNHDRGLSPRLRGNDTRSASRSDAKRSIPALAGERQVALLRKPIVRVYPRACGGTPCRTLVCWFSWGLSPRLRGNV